MKKNLSWNTALSIFILVIIGAAKQSQAQAIYKQSGESYITIAGTSTLHEWTMTSSQPQLVAAIETTAEGNVSQLKSLVLAVQSQSLKSAHNGMDKNAYSALKVDKYKAINFIMTSTTVQKNIIQCLGNLSIAGVTKQVSVDATCALKNGKSSLICSGRKQLKMSDYQVEAPSFMFGTVKTGDEITLSFNIELVPNKN
jgi:polyisoprenoid-binding protein YceI